MNAPKGFGVHAGQQVLTGKHPTLGEVPTARVAVLVHTGDYDTIGDTYRTLGAWVARHAEHAGERVREWYVIGPTDTDDPTEFRTEISWPIRSVDPTPTSEGAPS